MKNFRVSDGDLSLTSARHADMVYGDSKLFQDLSLWLQEPLGIGYTTPGFGSTLNTTMDRDTLNRKQGRFIGRQSDEAIASEIEAEVDRILTLYQQNQIQQIRDAQVAGRLHLYSKKEILDSIDNIIAMIVQDRVVVRADVRTGMSNINRTIVADVSAEGATVATS